MAFDQPTRNRLARFVNDARALLTDEFTRQCQNDYGLDPSTGDVAAMATLGHLDDAGRETAQLLRDTMAHYVAAADTGTVAKAKKARREALDRIVREQAFTVLNRLCALRMAEARELLIQSVANGYQSKGFQLYFRVAGTALGETGEAYRCYLFSVFDELALDLAVLFDRFSPQGRLFPRESNLLALLDLINHPDLESLWPEDETIGWIYQYFNTPDERRQMRAESQAPRNSRELAVRNQFFTPRYVVEFLTDNTLGRIWYEMTQGQTSLKDTCRYLVRRPDEVFLGAETEGGWSSRLSVSEKGQDTMNRELQRDTMNRELQRDAPQPRWPDEPAGMARLLQEGTADDWPEFDRSEESVQAMIALAHTVDGYARHADADAWQRWLSEITQTLRDQRLTDLKTQDLLDALFLICRNDRHGGDGSVYREAWFIAACNEVRRRALQSREPDLSQQELLRQPVFVPYRPLKDPRDIKMLDPACGSMHFGLYAFDLFERIYEESGQWAEGSRQSAVGSGQTATGSMQMAEGSMQTAAEAETAYSAPSTAHCPLPTDIPRLIIERNIHGIDIDPRAVQIAGLSLWLRAQRSWRDMGIKAPDRPRIERSNVVCAEPMPGDEALLDEFLRSLQKDRLESLIRRVLSVPENQQIRATERMAEALCGLVKTVWQEMKLAGEAGSLLKIEESLRDAIAAGKEEWEEKLPLFRITEFGLDGTASKSKYLTSVPGEEEDFWNRAEAIVLAALEAYAEQAENGGGFQRRLFARDAARGFAFIDLCRQSYDVALMNPPFGLGVLNFKRSFEAVYPNAKTDVYPAFVERGLQLVHARGMLGAITSRTGFFLSSFQNWREYTLLNAGMPTVFADLGPAVMDSAMVESAAYCIAKRGTSHATFFRLLTDRAKQWKLHQHIERLDVSSRHVFLLKPAEFGSIPGSPFAYWVTPTIRKLFREFPKFESGSRFAYSGTSTGNDARFIRLWWEIGSVGQRWRYYTKGGRRSPYFAEIPCVIDWKSEGIPIEISYAGGRVRKVHFGREAMTWPLRGACFSASAVPRGCIFGTAGKVAIAEAEDLPWLLALLNSKLFDSLITLFAGKVSGVQYEVGLIQSIPVPHFSERARNVLSEHAQLIWSSKRSLASKSETSHAFVLPALLQVEGGSIENRSQRWLQHVRDINASCVRTQEIIDDICFGEYQIDDCERDVAAEGLRGPEDESNAIRCDQTVNLEEGDSIENAVSSKGLAAELASWAFGVAIGRFDVRTALSTKQNEQGSGPTPFAELPSRPKAIVSCEAASQSNLPVRIPPDGILVDDLGHSSDAARATESVIELVIGGTNEEISELVALLANQGLRSWLRDSLFVFHLNQYSESSRQAPIYWPLSTPSRSYTLWLYYHRLTDQTLYTCVNDFVEPKLKQVAGEAAAVRRKAVRSTDDERELERLTDMERELTDLRDELLRLAQFWKPNLNDGVQITAAPLWKLFQHRAWQRKLKETWETLEAGDYDWAHLAMSIWPARVVPKCVADRSLAIAHDLEDLFWVEDFGRWRNLNEPDEEIEEQKRRQRAAVRDRVRGLLERLAADHGDEMASDVYRRLAAGDWDDLQLALLVWPERVADTCWDDAALAAKLKVKLPARRTKATRKKFVQQLAAAGAPDLAEKLAASLEDSDEPFHQVWKELDSGDRDHQPLALALWPDRVVDKCAQDVPLAQAHEIQRFFWVQHPTEAWRRRVSPEAEVTNEVRRRSGQ